jgi:hypothetical protein
MICPQRNFAAQVEEENVLAEGIGKMDLSLNDSDVLTSPTDTGSVSDDDTSTGGGGVGYWLLGGIIPLAKSIKETAGGVADSVYRSAVAAAQEFQPDYGSDDDYEEDEVERREQLRLPWEIRCHDNDIIDHDYEEENEHDQEHQPTSNVTVSYEEDAVLKEKIHALSAKDETFLKPFTAAASSMEKEERFIDKSRIELVNRILQIDEQLRATHARMSGRSNFQEIFFWRNYFHHCQETRTIHLQQKATMHLHKNNNKTQQQEKELRDEDDENDKDDGNDESSSQSSSSLVPADDDAEDINDNDDDARHNAVQEFNDDDASFIYIPTPPPSTGIRSVDSMVFIDDM